MRLTSTCTPTMSTLISLLSLLPVHLVVAATPDVARSDQWQIVEPSAVQIEGLLSQRLKSNRDGILLHKDEDALLAPFQSREPGDDTWLGEHVGKWLSAASRMQAQTPTKALGEKLDRVVEALIATQLEDGYLGTYAPQDRWKGWDVWVHKYNMLGLLDYYQLTGNEAALQSCLDMADLLIHTFGPDRKDIIKAGANAGMAATSLLDPITRLYQVTGEQDLLEFARYITRACDSQPQPRIITTLIETGNVRKVANAKAYEMISTIIGLLEMYRIEGRDELLTSARLAFEDIIANRLYVTGGCSYGERFQVPHYFPNAGHVAETCVTMSLMQLYRELLKLTGDIRCGHAAENLIFNHLLAHQHPDGQRVCYYTPLWGHKTYMNFLGCCISSGPRALSYILQFCYLHNDDTLLVNLLTASSVKTRLQNGAEVSLVQKTDYPFADTVVFDIQPSDVAYTLAVRIPDTAASAEIIINNSPTRKLEPGQIVTIEVNKAVDQITLKLDRKWQIVEGGKANPGLFALEYGGIFYAFDLAANPHIENLQAMAFDKNLDQLDPTVDTNSSDHRVTINGYLRSLKDHWQPTEVVLLPYMDAGLTDYFSVWLADRQQYNPLGISLFTSVHELVSRDGRQRGSFADNRIDTFTTTDNGRKSDSDWFEVNCRWHTEYNVIVFRHGRNADNGGWFDTSTRKPRVLLKSWHDYEEVAVIEDYPDTTATDPGTLKAGQGFRVVIPKDKRQPAHRVRIEGIPATGNDSSQSHASCSEIQVFYDPRVE